MILNTRRLKKLSKNGRKTPEIISIRIEQKKEENILHFGYKVDTHTGKTDYNHCVKICGELKETDPVFIGREIAGIISGFLVKGNIARRVSFVENNIWTGLQRSGIC